MEDDEFRRALAVLDSYNVQLDALTRQVEVLQLSLQETSRARESLKAIGAAKEGDEILVPVGTGSFVPVRVSGKKTAIVGIGNRISVEKDMDEAAEFIASRGNEISEALKKSVSALSEMEVAAERLTSAVQQEYRNRQIVE
ncbi:MAG: prefoldin subunit alpha [Candidatus Methanoplasma sp.]|jgi:prefoldin alpha subunit|nr:prefoldin subunit alpha [Candidatus Methanoplasma sp.]